MKKLITLAAMTFVFATTLSAQQEKDRHPTKDNQNKQEKRDDKRDDKEGHEWEGHDVNDQAKKRFDRDFDKTSEPRWERTSKYDEVSFNRDGKNSRAFYGTNSQLVGSSSDRIFTDLPNRAQRVISRRYKSYTPGDVILFKDNKNFKNDMTLYNTRFTSQNSYFVEMKNDYKRIILRVNMNGDVSYFAQTQ